MNQSEKTKGYRESAVAAIDYIEMCARRNIVPLLHDANVMRQRFNVLDKAKVERGR